MSKQTTVRLPDDVAEKAELVARTQGISVNQLIINSLSVQIEQARNDRDFMDRARFFVERDKAILDALAE